MRAAVDSNVWVSAALRPAGPPGQLLAAFRSGRFTLVTSEPLLAELAEVFSRPRLVRQGVTPDASARILALLRSGAELVSIEGTVRVCRDPDDDVVIETAIEGKAEVLVSGDHDLTQAAEVAECLTRAGVRVVTVRQFLQELDEP